jgi:predicted deacetylase
MVNLAVAEQTCVYLVRFDDLCPTTNWRVWSEIEATVCQYGVCPIVAVVPDNRDPKLMVDAPLPDFWERVRRWQSLGWAIGLHGHQHHYTTNKAGLMRLAKRSEFAGLPRKTQEEKVHNGLDVFADHGVRADVWVAPSHSFDETTVDVLAAAGVRVISDGLWPWPHTDRRGVTWVPQQVWSELRRRPPGVWTVCYHHNHWTDDALARFAQTLGQYHDRITTLDAVVREFAGRPITFADRWQARCNWMWNHRLRPLAKRLLRP